MQSLEPYWGRQALDFVDAIEASKTSASVIAQFERMIGNLGFHAYIMAGIPTSGQSPPQLTIAKGWPAQWVELYNRENPSAVDPVSRHWFNTFNPFQREGAPYDRGDDRPAH